MRELLRELRAARARNRASIHCAVVETRGSTPQKAGAVMLVFSDGSQVGTLGGGCVEAEVRRLALQLDPHDPPKLLSFTLDDDYGWDDGLICGGRMTFIAQPVAEGQDEYFFSLADLAEAGAGFTEAVVLDPSRAAGPLGARFLFDHLGQCRNLLHADSCPSSIVESVRPLTQRPRPHTENGVAYLPVLPRCRLVIVGGGHVGQAVAELARQVDFDIWVIDDREKYACRERFPMAQQCIVGDIADTLKQLETDENTYCLIVTRGHAHDEEALFHLAEKTARYVGLIGSRRKIRMIFQDLRQTGITDTALRKVYAPLGVDIGSQTVPEIAVSIVSQLVGHRNRGVVAFPPPTHDYLDKPWREQGKDCEP